MVTKVFNVDTKELSQHVIRLEMIHRSALPVTVRRTLNDIALDARKVESQKQFNKNFTIRKKSFINSHMGATLCRGELNIDKMFTEVGVIKGKSGAGDRLYLQEEGGRLANREKIPQTAVRIGANASKLVSKKRYFSKYESAPLGQVSRTPKETIIKTEKVIYSIKKGGIWSTLYIYDTPIKVDKESFIAPGSRISHKKADDFFIYNARKKQGLITKFDKRP